MSAVVVDSEDVRVGHNSRVVEGNELGTYSIAELEVTYRLPLVLNICCVLIVLNLTCRILISGITVSETE